MLLVVAVATGVPAVQGDEATERYIINEILRIYAAQGERVDAKHLEVIVRQMFSRVQVEEPGDTQFVTGDIVSKAVAKGSRVLFLGVGTGSGTPPP